MTSFVVDKRLRIRFYDWMPQSKIDWRVIPRNQTNDSMELIALERKYEAAAHEEFLATVPFIIALLLVVVGVLQATLVNG